MRPFSLVNTLKIGGAVVATALAAQAHAADTVEWSVRGTIAPAACGITLSGGGEAHFNDLANASVQAWGAATAPDRYSGLQADVSRSLELAVNCTAPSKFALAFTDNRAATVAGPAGEQVSFGLGSYTPPGGAATNIGRYLVNASGLLVKADTAAAAVSAPRRLLTTGVATATSAWTAAEGQQASFLSAGHSLGFGLSAAAATPDSLVSVTGPLVFFIEPLKAVVDTATSSIPLDGSATITLVAL